jgi:DNA polymerase-3 subunit gamma/tau
MSSKALYRKYRSKSLSEIVGQSHVTDILARSLSKGRVAHAYLLTGPRGIGKTSIARILAHEINQLPYTDETNHLDIIEIDAASNNGVEDVRDLREKVQIAPVSASKKIYIIDEVHMLSKAAFNALLKTLEEPPEHAVFILATTDVDKLPQTIISRTQRFSLKAINPDDAMTHLKHIAKEEKIKIDDEALRLIALRGEGSFRDSISLLDQLQSLADDKTGITKELVEEFLGLAPSEQINKILEAYDNKDLETIVKLLDESEKRGIQTSLLTSQLIAAVREQVVTKPQLIHLLDDLLLVAKSSNPSVKLLTVLGSQTSPKPKSAALSAPAPTISAPIKELEKQATKAKPHLPKQQESSSIAAELRKESSHSVPASGPVHSENSFADVPLELATAPDVSSNEGTQKRSPTISLDWDKLIAFTKQNFVAINSVLSKCTAEQKGDTLVLYTSNAFYKKKLDDAKYRAVLVQALNETGAGDLIIETIGTPPPPKDSTAAAVAAIMGGGEEVTL